MIEDDGRGFDPVDSSSAGLGLLGMRERVELLDGTFQIEAVPRAGTTLIVELPLVVSAGQPAASRARAASVRPKAGANLNP